MPVRIPHINVLKSKLLSSEDEYQERESEGVPKSYGVGKTFVPTPMRERERGGER